MLELLKQGDTIEVHYTDEEPGCDVHHDAYGTILWADDKVKVALDFTENERPEHWDEEDEDE